MLYFNNIDWSRKFEKRVRMNEKEGSAGIDL